MSFAAPAARLAWRGAIAKGRKAPEKVVQSQMVVGNGAQGRHYTYGSIDLSQFLEQLKYGIFCEIRLSKSGPVWRNPN